MSSSFAAPPQPTLLVAAAADLAPLEAPLAQGFQRATGTRFRFVLGASGLLARQIEQGAPYDIFLSADEKFVRDLAAAGRLDPASVHTYAYGRLALWSRSGSIKALGDLRSPRVLHVAIANPAHAPYGLAAKQALEQQGLWAALERKIVYGENVRQALQFAETGNADAVVTAWSLLVGRGGAVLLPQEWHSPIRQACGVVRGPQAEAARRFLDYLGGPEGRKILQEHGLTPP